MASEIAKRVAGKKHVVATYEVRGERIDVSFDPTNDWRPFSATYKGTTAVALDLAALVEELKRVTKRDRVTIHLPFSRQDGRDGYVTGKHTGNGNLLVTWDDGISEQLNSYSGRGWGSQTFFKRLSPVQKQELKALKAAVKKAQEDLNEFEKEYGVDLNEAAEDAIQEIVELAVAAEETPSNDKETT